MKKILKYLGFLILGAFIFEIALDIFLYMNGYDSPSKTVGFKGFLGKTILLIGAYFWGFFVDKATASGK